MTDNEARIQSVKNEKAKNTEVARSNISREQEERRKNRTAEKQKAAGQMIDLLGVGMNAGKGLAKVASLAANDPKWYSRTPGVAKDAASISFYNPQNRELRVGDVTVYTQQLTETPYVSTAQENKSAIPVPNIGVLGVVPCFGTATGVSNDPVNVFTRLLFTNVRRENAGSAPYFAPDLGVYFLLSDSAYAFAAEITRLYGLLNYYTASNLNLPRYAIEALGYDFDDMLLHIADLRAFIRYYIMKLNTRKIPKDFTILARHWQLFSSIYKDANPDDAKAQLYMIRPDGFYTYATQAESGAGYCRYKPYRAVSSFDELVEYGTSLIDSLFDRRDAAIMSGDILKAYSDSGCYVVNSPDENYQVKPVYDLHMLMQIYNAKNWSVAAAEMASGEGRNNFDYWQTDDGNLKMGTNFVIRSADGSNTTREVLNLASDASTEPEYILEYTRLRPAVRVAMDEAGNNIGQVYQSWGTELPVSYIIYSWTAIPSSGAQQFGYASVCDTIVVNSARPEEAMDGVGAAITQLAYVAAFDFSPYPKFISGYLGSAKENNYALMLQFTDLQNYTTISNAELTKMHTAALLSQYSIM